MTGGMSDFNMDDPNMMNNPEGEEQLPSDFNTNFDAGVEADEETDPKKFIQQLTGKLSQSLNSYNNENGEPDVELGKYVLGMLIQQGTKGMDEKDRKAIIKKINTKNTEDNSEDMDVDVDMEVDNTEDIPQDDNMNLPQNESKIVNITKKQLFENFGLDIVDTSNKTKEVDTKIANDTKRNRRTKPFEAPKKFK